MIDRLLSLRFPIPRLDLGSQFLLRLIIVIGVLFLSAFLATRVSITYLAAIMGVVAVLILVRWPQLGLLGVVGALVVPFSIATGSQTPLNATVLLIPALLALWLADMFRHRQFQLAPSPTTFPMLALAISTTISLLGGSMPWNLFASTAPIAAQVGGWAIFVFSIGVFLLVGNQVRDRRWLMALTGLYLTIGGLFMVGRLGVPPLDSLSRMMTGLGSADSMFWIWIMALASGQLLFNQKLSQVMRVLLATLMLVTLYVAWFQSREWASGWLPPMAAIGIIFWLRFRRIGFVVGVVSIILFITMSSAVLQIVAADPQGSLFPWQARQAAWQIALEVARASPVLGLGPANPYYYVELTPIMGYYVKFNSHNQYVDLISQTGFLGLGLFLWSALAVLYEGWILKSRIKDGFDLGYVCACLGGLVGMLLSGMLGDWVLPFVYNVGLTGFRSSVLGWLFLGGLVALAQIHKESPQ